jgi:hypothetical protein
VLGTLIRYCTLFVVHALKLHATRILTVPHLSVPRLQGRFGRTTRWMQTQGRLPLNRNNADCYHNIPALQRHAAVSFRRQVLRISKKPAWTTARSSLQAPPGPESFYSS